MTHILRIDSSARLNDSVSRQLTDEFLASLKIAPDSITVRDLAECMPHIDDTWLSANGTDQAQWTEAQGARARLSSKLIEELKTADALVIGVALYNFSIPSTLKAWIDHICRAGETFRYMDNGPIGLLENKRAVILLATGGTQAESAIDFATDYLRHILGFVGITDVELIAADRIFADRDIAFSQARARIAEVTGA